MAIVHSAKTGYKTLGFSCLRQAGATHHGYREANPGIFMFTRPVYTNETWVTTFIDYGIFTTEYGLLLNKFDNKKK